MVRCASASDTLKCLRQANVTALQAANTEINASAFFFTNVFIPVVDGTFIIDRPTQLLKDKKVNTVRSSFLRCLQLLMVPFPATRSSISMLWQMPMKAISLLTKQPIRRSQRRISSLTSFRSLDQRKFRQVLLLMRVLGCQISSWQIWSLVNVCSFTFLVCVVFCAEAFLATFVCPTYYLLNAIGLNAYKVCSNPKNTLIYEALLTCLWQLLEWICHPSCLSRRWHCILLWQWYCTPICQPGLRQSLRRGFPRFRNIAHPECEMGQYECRTRICAVGWIP